MQQIFYLLGIAAILNYLHLLDKWYILAAIAIFIIGKHIIKAIYYILYKQFELTKASNGGAIGSTSNAYSSYSNLINSNTNKEPPTKDSAQDALELYKQRVEKAMKDRIKQK